MNRWYCQPPCEAVSWNMIHSGYTKLQRVSLLVRLWVEIHPTQNYHEKAFVSLLVRLWVEIGINPADSAYWFVSLLVRLWVEIPSSLSFNVVSPSASLWGCELKSFILSTNISATWSASLWGCELKWYVSSNHCNSCGGQPPCEAVSWNTKLVIASIIPVTVSLLVRLWVEILQNEDIKEI